MEIGVKFTGGKKFESWLNNAEKVAFENLLHRLGAEGVSALSSATPVDTGLTAGSWYYEVKTSKNGATLIWKNDNSTRDGTPIPILIQYGYTTGTGGWVEGRDFINPAIRPIFDNIAKVLAEEVRYG